MNHPDTHAIRVVAALALGSALGMAHPEALADDAGTAITNPRTCPRAAPREHTNCAASARGTRCQYDPCDGVTVPTYRCDARGRLRPPDQLLLIECSDIETPGRTQWLYNHVPPRVDIPAVGPLPPPDLPAV